MHATLLPRAVAALFGVWLILATGGACAGAINGAIYTSTFDHSAVNANQYPTKPDVYLNGGPNNFPQCVGGKLDDGSYYFQVSDPSGQSLLSSDDVFNRRFQVEDGVISANLGTHGVGFPSACGSQSIQLVPFDDTPNGGGVYKVWITRASDFETACGGPAIDCGLAGFVPGNTKTDNFKVGPTTPVPVTGSVRAFKFYDANANGQYDNGIDPLLDGWKMTLQSFAQAVDSTHYTSAGSTSWANLIPGDDYTVEEGVPGEGNWVHSATIYVGHDGSPENPAGPLSVVAGQTTDVLFGNYCTVPSNGRTLGFWSNKNGQKLFDAGDLAAMVALNLRNANGSPFDPASYAAFRTWLLNGTATNMAYMLSVQMAAMQLNVRNGFVDGSGYYVPAGVTVNQLLAAANASLGSDGLTLAGHPQRAYQEDLKDWLDALNNGDGLLSPTPCAYSFP